MEKLSFPQKDKGENRKPTRIIRARFTVIRALPTCFNDRDKNSYITSDSARSTTHHQEQSKQSNESHQPSSTTRQHRAYVKVPGRGQQKNPANTRASKISTGKLSFSKGRPRQIFIHHRIFQTNSRVIRAPKKYRAVSRAHSRTSSTSRAHHRQLANIIYFFQTSRKYLSIMRDIARVFARYSRMFADRASRRAHHPYRASYIEHFILYA